MRKFLAVCVAVAALLGVAAAQATVNFNTQTQVGTVDRSDVQSAFGWSNSQTAHNARRVTFVEWWFVYNEYLCSSNSLADAGGVVEWGINSQSHGMTYNLQGRSGQDSGSGAPTLGVGDACPNGDGSTVVRLTFSGVNGPILMAQFGGQEATLAAYSS